MNTNTKKSKNQKRPRPQKRNKNKKKEKKPKNFFSLMSYSRSIIYGIYLYRYLVFSPVSRLPLYRGYVS